MLNEKGFDDWAQNYDKQKSNSVGYPFGGYYNVLSFARNLINVNTNETKILDIGIGTGELTKELSKSGAKIFGVDFSEKMIELAKSKISTGIFEKFDLRNGLPKNFQTLKFDFVVSSYALHHLNKEEKANVLNQCLTLIKPNGKIIIADIAFKTKVDFDNCRKKYINTWDDSEFYFIKDEFVNSFKAEQQKISYSQISECAGVFVIEQNSE
jgi:putative AdoMet-dependent methyltransferase